MAAKIVYEPEYIYRPAMPLGHDPMQRFGVFRPLWCVTCHSAWPCRIWLWHA